MTSFPKEPFVFHAAFGPQLFSSADDFLFFEWFKILAQQMMLKNLTDDAIKIAANAKIEDMSKLFKNQLSGGKDVKNAMSNIMVRSSTRLIACCFFFFFLLYFILNICSFFQPFCYF